MNKFESPEQVKIPEEMAEYAEICSQMAGRKDQPVELHLLKLQELAESLYKKDEEFKAIVDEEMKGVTDREFESEGEEENSKDRLQAYLNALSTYAERLELDK